MCIMTNIIVYIMIYWETTIKKNIYYIIPDCVENVY